MRQGKAITCPQCLSWTGHEEEFPCEVCGHRLGDYSEPAAKPAASTSAGKPESEAPTSEPHAYGADGNAPPGSSGGPAPDPVEQTEAPTNGDATAEQRDVECPTCYQWVPPGPKCLICEGLL